jgi:hypothetical protein
LKIKRNSKNFAGSFSKSIEIIKKSLKKVKLASIFKMLVKFENLPKKQKKLRRIIDIIPVFLGGLFYETVIFAKTF